MDPTNIYHKTNVNATHFQQNTFRLLPHNLNLDSETKKKNNQNNCLLTFANKITIGGGNILLQSPLFMCSRWAFTRTLFISGVRQGLQSWQTGDTQLLLQRVLEHCSGKTTMFLSAVCISSSPIDLKCYLLTITKKWYKISFYCSIFNLTIEQKYTISLKLKDNIPLI